jgi:hypothetical protein
VGLVSLRKLVPALKRWAIFSSEERLQYYFI